MRYASVTLSEHKSLTTFPVKVSKDLLDISPYVWLGQNKLCFSQVDSMLDYVLALYSHYPTESQIIPLHARWDERWGGGAYLLCAILYFPICTQQGGANPGHERGKNMAPPI